MTDSDGSRAWRRWASSGATPRQGRRGLRPPAAAALGVALTAQWITRRRPDGGQPPRGFPPPSSAHWLGTDQFGRDILSRVILATQVTVKVTSAACLFAVVLGVPIGMFVGYRGGWIEAVTMRADRHAADLPDHHAGDRHRRRRGPDRDRASSSRSAWRRRRTSSASPAASRCRSRRSSMSRRRSPPAPAGRASSRAISGRTSPHADHRPGDADPAGVRAQRLGVELSGLRRAAADARNGARC